MKKVLICLLAVSMVLAMAGCDLLSFLNMEEIIPTTPKELSLGTVSGSKYESEFIGIGYTLPSGWSFYTEDQIKEMNQYVEDKADQNYLDLIKNADIVYDMMATSSAGTDNVLVTLEKKPAATLDKIDLKQSLETSFKAFKTSFENMGYRNISHEITTVTIDGKGFDAMHINATYGGMKMYQTCIVIKCNGYLATIAFTTFDAAGTAPLLENIYLLK